MSWKAWRVGMGGKQQRQTVAVTSSVLVLCVNRRQDQHKGICQELQLNCWCFGTLFPQSPCRRRGFFYFFNNTQQAPNDFRYLAPLRPLLYSLLISNHHYGGTRRQPAICNPFHSISAADLRSRRRCLNSAGSPGIDSSLSRLISDHGHGLLSCSGNAHLTRHGQTP